MGTATLLIGANLPDLDVIAYLDGPEADLAFRRGWTHGVLALVVLPFLLAGAMLLVERVARRLAPSSPPPSVSARELLVLSGVSILTHPILDTLNTYGVRWLMPFDGRWFYGDAVFIVDPWLWILLGLGVLLSRHTTRPARVALAVGAAYAGGMALSGVAARRMVAEELVRRGGGPVDRLLLSPRLATPLRRTVVAAQGERYLVGEFRWAAEPRLSAELRAYPRARPRHPAVELAAATPVGRRFLGWARFPTYSIEDRGGGGYVVHIVDLRYADRPGMRFGAVSIPVRVVSSTSSYTGSAPPPRTPR